MQFMLMCLFDEKRWQALPEAEQNQIMQDYGEFTQSIVRSGHFRAKARLRPASAAVTVRRRDGARLVVDGPFAETREQLGGFFLIECRDLDEAIEIAGRVPTLRAGGLIEVRPLERATGQ